jgi:hypothetical protein
MPVGVALFIESLGTRFQEVQRTANLVSGSDPGTLIRRQTNKKERRRGAKGNRAEHKGELLERDTG